MSKESMRAYVETRVKNLMAANYPTTPIQYDNVPFIQPKSEHYIAIHILDGESFQANLGNSFRERHPGVLQIDVLAPRDMGTKLQNQIAKTIGTAFTALNDRLSDGASVVFRTPSYPDLGEQGPWKVCAVSVGYYRDERAVQAQP
jgi:Bacteriophage related domain of unknown function